MKSLNLYQEVLFCYLIVLTTVFDFKISFNNSLQEPLMLGFTTLGLNADSKMLKKEANCW